VESGQTMAAAARQPGWSSRPWATGSSCTGGNAEGASGKHQVSAEQMEISRLRAELRGSRWSVTSWKSDGILRKGPEVKYAFIQRHRRIWPIRVQCRVLGSAFPVTTNIWRGAGRSPAAPSQRRSVTVHISAPMRRTAGLRLAGIWRQLRAQGVRVGKQRVQRLMQKHGIQARGKRRFRVTTTDSRHDLPIAPNL